MRAAKQTPSKKLLMGSFVPNVDLFKNENIGLLKQNCGPFNKICGHFKQNSSFISKIVDLFRKIVELLN